MRRLFVVLAFLLLLASMASANEVTSNDVIPSDDTPLSHDIYTMLSSPKKVVGVFLEAPLSFVDNETVRKLVPDKASEIFAGSKFKLLPFDETAIALRTYQEDHRMIINEYYSTPLNRADIQSIGKELGLTYALFIKITNSAPRASYVLFATTFKTTVTCDIRLLDIETSKYLISKQIVKDGSTSMLALLGMPDFNDAYNNALKKALNELEIDTSKL